MNAKVTVELELRPFTVPNYVLVGGQNIQMKTVLEDGPKYALKDLDEKVLSALCDQFRAAVFEKAEKDNPRL